MSIWEVVLLFFVFGSMLVVGVVAILFAVLSAIRGTGSLNADFTVLPKKLSASIRADGTRRSDADDPRKEPGYIEHG